ncbi:hypothetical protein N7456_004924 [Penicillium angulare]|uniref:Uncharacterized protein n=1 Tax=Penicillium angulare TaxID=116970 RepID=A0A9W9FXF4_9EURO|nr:hypothetical protein N7456_004924 [Penicillium angulare]
MVPRYSTAGDKAKITTA